MDNFKRQVLIASVFLLWTTSLFGQRFMIRGNDTLPYKEKMVIQTDTVHLGDNVYHPNDTLYEGSCRTFEKIKNKIINQTDEQCLPQGLWIISDSLSGYWTGNFKDGKSIGLWKKFDKKGKVLMEQETVSIGQDTYITKKINYSSGRPVVIVNRSFLAFYIKNIIAIMVIFFVAFFSRVFINSIIYNNENKTNLSPIYFNFGPLATESFRHSLLSVFTLWFFNYKSENKQLVFVSNAMSLIALTIFFGLIIGLAVTGEI